MGAAISQRPEPEVHVVVVQSQDNGQVGAKVVRKTRYRNMKNPTVNASKPFFVNRCSRTLDHFSSLKVLLVNLVAVKAGILCRIMSMVWCCIKKLHNTASLAM